MKLTFKIFSLLTLVVAFAACDKVSDLPFYGEGKAPVISASAAVIAFPPADSSKPVLTLSWTFPAHATDSSNIKYVIEIDSTGRNFSKAVSRTVVGQLSSTYLAKELNAILLGFGFAFNVAYDVDVRVTSSYLNNNERLTSNTIKLRMTPYKIPPKVAPPASGKLFLVGNATGGGWNNPVPVPLQEFAKLDSVTYAGVFDLSSNAEYLVLPVNGDWTNKYSVANKSLPGLALGGDFGYNLSDNFPSPTIQGKYIITLDFQAGKTSVKPFVGTLPTNLFIVGDATPGGWNNPVPEPAQKLTRLNSAEWQVSLAIVGAKQFLLLPVNGDWSNKYAVADNSIAGLWNGGTFGYNLPQNFPGPPTSGTYKVNVNFVNHKFTIKP